MILNDTFKSIGDYFNHEEEYLGEFFYESEKTEYEEWFGVSVNEILFTTSDDDDKTVLDKLVHIKVLA